MVVVMIMNILPSILDTAHISPQHHRQQWCTFFKPVYFWDDDGGDDDDDNGDDVFGDVGDDHDNVCQVSWKSFGSHLI